MQKNLYNIYFTTFLAIFAGSMMIPVTPFVVRGLGVPDYYIGIGSALYFFGVFLGGIIFGKLSDSFGRRNILYITTALDILGYIIFYFSTNIYGILISRLLIGFGGATFPIGQAYISDNSKDEEKTKNIALTGAIFGIAFVIGPSLGGLLFESMGLHIALIPILLLVANLVSISFLQNNKKIVEMKESLMKSFFYFKSEFYIFFLIAFLIGLGFSNIHTTYPLFLHDIFSLSERQVGFFLTGVGAVAIVHQAFFMKFVRRWFVEKEMMLYGALLLCLSFFAFSVNKYLFILLLLTPLTPIGMGTLNPALSGLVSIKGKAEAGKALGGVMAMNSLGGIIGAVVYGYLYFLSPEVTYLFTALIFGVICFIVIKKID